MRVNLDGSGQGTLVETGDWENPDHISDQSRWCVGIAVSKKLGMVLQGGSRASAGRILSAGLNTPEGMTD